ncbi:S41 family peptidase [Chitinophaga rhizosphaerae]|uniref:S41 family peptidase n=1 Tax=Chitinophaga rhizosphaerae TaxID=1864947 RepID=UPI000F8067B9|nr:S41 family peptidase [Chitinophaga rhizosphaerae]
MNRIVYCLLLLITGNTFAQSPLTRAQAVSDIDYYVRTMKASHYSPFAEMSEKEFDRRIGEIKNAIGDSIGIPEFLWKMYEVTALIGDAHATPQLGQPAFREDFQRPLFFPYRLLQDKNGVYVPRMMAIVHGLEPGEPIVSINGVKLDALRKELDTHLAGLPAFRREAGIRLFSYFLYLKGVRPPFTVTFREKGSPHTVVQQCVPLKAALAVSMPHITEPFVFDVRDGKVGYLDVRTLSASPAQFSAFLDSAFAAFRNANVHTLAVDLRNNSGGNTDLADILLSYISRKPYTWGLKSWKISQPYKDALIANGDTAASYLRRENGTIWNTNDPLAQKVPSRHTDSLFNGKVFFITGPFTFSSAMALADVVKTAKLGTIVGEPTGERTRDYGEAFTIELPSSKIRIQSTSSLSHGANGTRAGNMPVMPDVPIQPKVSDDRRGIDRAMAYILRQAK